MNEPTLRGGLREEWVADGYGVRVPVGRERECALLDGLLDSLPDRGAALLLRGDPGIGKTNMLDYVAWRAHGRNLPERGGGAGAVRAQPERWSESEPVRARPERGIESEPIRAQHACGAVSQAIRVLRTRGVESEAVLPYTVLADLLLPLRSHFAELPSTQRRALETCFALMEADEPNPYAVCVGTLGVLAAAGEAEPLVLLVDDLHWSDPSSRRALQFVARRLATERVALVMAARPAADDDVTWEDVPRLAIAPLEEEDCLRLLERGGVDLEEPAVTRLVRLSSGNPLVLVEYAAAIEDARKRGDELADTAWEMPGPMVERAWWGRMRTLSPETRTALLYVAACRVPELSLLERALAVNGLSLGALDEAEESGLIRAREHGYELRHPVLRPLVFRHCSVAQRLSAYRTLADLSAGEVRTWYLASAAAGPDETVASALADAAERSRRRGALGAAAHAWHRAAELSPSATDRAERLLNAARDAFYGGASRDAVDWCEQALRWSEDVLLTADIELLRGQACGWLGDPGRAHRSLVAAAEAVEPVDRFRACALYGAATLPAAMDGRIGRAVDTSARSAALADLLEEEAGAESSARSSRHLSNVMRGCALALAGKVPEGRGLLLAGRAALHGNWPLEEQQLAVQIGQALPWVDEREAATAVLDAVIDGARRDGVPALLPYALVGRCEAMSWSRWPMARAAGAEALRWAQELGHRAMTGYALLLLARLDGLRGDRAGCEDRITAYERHCGKVRGLELFAQAALGSAALTGGEPQAAAGHLERALSLADEMGLGNPNLMPFLTELAEAYVRTGERDSAVRLAGWIESLARSTGLAWPAAAHAHCRIMLASSADEAEGWLRTAERVHVREEMTFELARTQLVCGELLRRFRRPKAARGLLLASQLAFAGLGASSWRSRAAVELAAAGHRAADTRAPEPRIDRLTAQELQVALAVGDGLSNGEAAAALFVSRKTVEAHLTRVYRKLGVRSRSELAGYLVHADVVR
ncbi:LuxR C-terminal-related transcriptional regulator [Streptomyces sp. NBC_00035]|uniref:LuxR C-terminal-related transcriptional regulator n=1 Tax=Streptomyces sp. NBC_00035 TaxID=2903614 RepID=UPI00324CD9E2